VKPGILVAVVLGAAISLSAADANQRVWAARFALAPGGKVAVENMHGAVQVEGWDRAEVQLTVTKIALAPTDRLNDVRVSVESGENSLTFRTVYPNDLEEPIRVDYRLRVPHRVRLDRLRTLVGDISVHDIEGTVDARSLQGNIVEEDVAGVVTAQALTGDVAVSMCSLPGPSTPLSLDTVNGNVSLLLPPHSNADLELRTVAGHIDGDYMFQASSVPGDSTRRARLGKGGVRVRLETIRGNIRVAERDDLL
jgi:hypothetical protein